MLALKILTVVLFFSFCGCNSQREENKNSFSVNKFKEICYSADWVTFKIDSEPDDIAVDDVKKKLESVFVEIIKMNHGDLMIMQIENGCIRDRKNQKSFFFTGTCNVVNSEKITQLADIEKNNKLITSLQWQSMVITFSDYEITLVRSKYCVY